MGDLSGGLLPSSYSLSPSMCITRTEGSASPLRATEGSATAVMHPCRGEGGQCLVRGRRAAALHGTLEDIDGGTGILSLPLVDPDQLPTKDAGARERLVEIGAR